MNNLNKEDLHEKRKIFFDRIIAKINEPPKQVDFYLRQAEFHQVISATGSIIDHEFGDMWLPVEAVFYGIKRKMAYSIWQFGNILKIALVAYDREVEKATFADPENEFVNLWGKNNQPKVVTKNHEMFFEWEFPAEHLYDNFQNQETYILGIRHMHFRILRMIHDDCKKEYKLSKEIDEAEQNEHSEQN